MPLAECTCGAGGAPGSDCANATPAQVAATRRVKANRVLDFMADSAESEPSVRYGLALRHRPATRHGVGRIRPSRASELFGLAGGRLPAHQALLDPSDRA